MTQDNKNFETASACNATVQAIMTDMTICLYDRLVREDGKNSFLGFIIAGALANTKNRDFRENVLVALAHYYPGPGGIISGMSRDAYSFLDSSKRFEGPTIQIILRSPKEYALVLQDNDNDECWQRARDMTKATYEDEPWKQRKWKCDEKDK